MENRKSFFPSTFLSLSDFYLVHVTNYVHLCLLHRSSSDFMLLILSNRDMNLCMCIVHTRSELPSVLRCGFHSSKQERKKKEKSIQITYTQNQSRIQRRRKKNYIEEENIKGKSAQSTVMLCMRYIVEWRLHQNRMEEQSEKKKSEEQKQNGY